MFHRRTPRLELPAIRPAGNGPVAMETLCGVIGYPVKHSLSPAMHAEAARLLGLEFRYLPFEVAPQDLPAAIDRVRAQGMRGINVTIPHKTAVIPYLDLLDHEAESIGAVNTIVNDSGKLTGFNTDGRGFVESLMHDGNCKPAGKNVLVLGAGGAARGIVYALAAAGAGGIVISNRTTARGAGIVSAFESKFPLVKFGTIGTEPKELASAADSAGIIVNTTSVGMSGGGAENSMPLGPGFVRAGQTVCDIVYRPIETPFLMAARKAGAVCVDGLGMFVRQGDLAFRLWTGREFPYEAVRTRIHAILMGKGSI